MTEFDDPLLWIWAPESNDCNVYNHGNGSLDIFTMHKSALPFSNVIIDNDLPFFDNLIHRKGPNIIK